MALILLEENDTSADLATGHDFTGELSATSVPIRFAATAQFYEVETSGNMELHVEVLTTGNVSYGTHTVTAARVGIGGTPNRARVEFDKVFLLPVGFKAQFKIKSLSAPDTAVNTTLYVHDAHFATTAAEARLTVTPTISTAEYEVNDTVGAQMSFSVGASRGTVVGARILDKAKQSEPFEIWLFRASITGTSDANAFNPTDTELANLVGVLRINDWFDAGSNSIGQAENLPLAFAGLSGTTLYGWLVTRGTPDFGLSSDVIVELDVLKE